MAELNLMFDNVYLGNNNHIIKGFDMIINYLKELKNSVTEENYGLIELKMDKSIDRIPLFHSAYHGPQLHAINKTTTTITIIDRRKAHKFEGILI